MHRRVFTIVHAHVVPHIAFSSLAMVQKIVSPALQNKTNVNVLTLSTISQGDVPFNRIEQTIFGLKFPLEGTCRTNIQPIVLVGSCVFHGSTTQPFCSGSQGKMPIFPDTDICTYILSIFFSMKGKKCCALCALCSPCGVHMDCLNPIFSGIK